jgi:hypothetical protein
MPAAIAVASAITATVTAITATVTAAACMTAAVTLRHCRRAQEQPCDHRYRGHSKSANCRYVVHDITTIYIRASVDIKPYGI